MAQMQRVLAALEGDCPPGARAASGMDGGRRWRSRRWWWWWDGRRAGCRDCEGINGPDRDGGDRAGVMVSVAAGGEALSWR